MATVTRRTRQVHRKKGVKKEGRGRPPFFWDCRPETVDVQAQAPFVLERILEYGSLAAVRWALETYGTERIKEFLRGRGARTLSRKTVAFWTLLLGLEGEECFERSSLSRSRPFWNY